MEAQSTWGPMVCARTAIHAEQVRGKHETTHEISKPEIRPQWQRNQRGNSWPPFIIIFSKLS